MKYESMEWEHRVPVTDEQIAKGASFKTWNRPKTYRRSRNEYCLLCEGLHRKGKCPAPTAGKSSSAFFSACGRYRYELWRRWRKEGPWVNFVMLNPSTADEVRNDPTVERCERRARAWNYGGLVVTNIFAFRATDPTVMKRQADPIGPENDAHLVEAARVAKLVVCAWGRNGLHMNRGEQVRRMLAKEKPLHCLRLCAGGIPEHPLYIPYAVVPAEWI